MPPPSPPLDVDALVKPIPGPNPAGGPMPDKLERDLRDACKEPDPFDENPKKPAWPALLQESITAFTETSKDLLLAVYLLQVATSKDGAPGLRDGLRLLHRLAVECWDRVHPLLPKPATTPPPLDPVEAKEARERAAQELEEVMTRRAGYIAVLNARFPRTVTAVPLIKIEGRAYAQIDIHAKDRKAELDLAAGKAKPEALRATFEDLTAAQQALKDLTGVLDQKLVVVTPSKNGEEKKENLTPDFLSEETPTNLGTAIAQCIALVVDVAKKRGVSLTDPPPGAPAVNQEQPSAVASDTGSAAPAGVANTRDGLYRQLGQIADRLKVLEPHSPIPYLLERCVKLGNLPFPELMKSIVTQSETIKALDQLLGIEPEKSADKAKAK